MRSRAGARLQMQSTVAEVAPHERAKASDPTRPRSGRPHSLESVDRVLVECAVRQHTRGQLGIGADQVDLIGENVRRFVQGHVLLDLALALLGQIGLQAALVGLQTIVLHTLVLRRDCIGAVAGLVLCRFG